MRNVVQDHSAGATLLAHYVKNPSNYAVINFSDSKQAIGIEEQPTDPKSNYAVAELYFYSNDVVAIAEQLTPSPRGQLENTDINNTYLQQQQLQVESLSRGTAWLDTGTHQKLLDAANFISVRHRRTPGP